MCIFCTCFTCFKGFTRTYHVPSNNYKMGWSMWCLRQMAPTILLSIHMDDYYIRIHHHLNYIRKISYKPRMAKLPPWVTKLAKRYPTIWTWSRHNSASTIVASFHSHNYRYTFLFLSSICAYPLWFVWRSHQTVSLLHKGIFFSISLKL